MRECGTETGEAWRWLKCYIKNQMIRKFKDSDIAQVLSLWLEVSIKAHDFIDKEFWESKIEDMKEIYIPSGETYVYEENSIIKGFVSLCNDTLAAIFVASDSQGNGIGTELINKAKDIRSSLTLTVYKENLKSVNFYKKNGFKAEKEQLDPHTGHTEIVMKLKPKE